MSSGVTKYGLFVFLLVIMVTVGLFGGHFGYEVDGVPQGGAVFEELDLDMGWLDFLEPVVKVFKWIWDSLEFMFLMVTFQIDDMPVFISAIFVVMSIMVMFMIVSLIRGTN